MEVGREIRRRREARGWSQAKLAGAAGMGVSGVSQIETGTRNPSTVTLEKLARALDTEVADLFPKAQAPLPLEDVGRGIFAIEAQASGRLYTEFEFFGRVLVQNWKDDLEEWGTKFPPEEIPDLFDFGRLTQWARDIGHTKSMYQALAQDPQVLKREELEDTLRLLETAEREALGLVKRVFEPARTLVEFRRIWDANDLGATMSEVESR